MLVIPLYYEKTLYIFSWTAAAFSLNVRQMLFTEMERIMKLFSPEFLLRISFPFSNFALLALKCFSEIQKMEISQNSFENLLWMMWNVWNLRKLLLSSKTMELHKYSLLVILKNSVKNKFLINNHKRNFVKTLNQAGYWKRVGL